MRRGDVGQHAPRAPWPPPRCAARSSGPSGSWTVIRIVSMGRQVWRTRANRRSRGRGGGRPVGGHSAGRWAPHSRPAYVARGACTRRLTLVPPGTGVARGRPGVDRRRGRSARPGAGDPLGPVGEGPVRVGERRRRPRRASGRPGTPTRRRASAPHADRRGPGRRRRPPAVPTASASCGDPGDDLAPQGLPVEAALAGDDEIRPAEPVGEPDGGRAPRSCRGPGSPRAAGARSRGHRPRPHPVSRLSLGVEAEAPGSRRRRSPPDTARAPGPARASRPSARRSPHWPRGTRAAAMSTSLATSTATSRHACRTAGSPARSAAVTPRSAPPPEPSRSGSAAASPPEPDAASAASIPAPASFVPEPPSPTTILRAPAVPGGEQQLADAAGRRARRVAPVRRDEVEPARLRRLDVRREPAVVVLDEEQRGRRRVTERTGDGHRLEPPGDRRPEHVDEARAAVRQGAEVQLVARRRAAASPRRAPGRPAAR